MTVRPTTLSEVITHFQQLTEREKSGLAREIHDDLGGYLIGAMMDLSILAPHIAGALGPEAHQKMVRVRQALASAVELTRRFTEQLRPTLLDNVGLFTALRWQLKIASERTHIKCVGDLPETEPRLNSRALIALFRSSEEALAIGMNRASVTEVEVVGSVDEKELSLRFTADGGFLPDKPTDIVNLMLESVRHRIRCLGGTVDVENPRSGGIVLAMRTPTANITVVQ
jgi:two-component system, NarL family, sensor histidine kinase UhpB